MPDTLRSFWVPVHKLFDGGECLRGQSLTVRLAANHRNEKIRRSHLRFLAEGHDGGWTEPHLGKFPFIIESGIAEFSTEAANGSWLLTPVPHARLVEAAEYDGRPLTYHVPKSTPGGPWRAYQSSLDLLPQPSGARTAPEYLHARHVYENGTDRDLNREPDVVDKVSQGGYQARHYVDYTGDGWIDVECSELALEVPRRLPAYSIVASPDFFPRVDQTDLMQWTEQSAAPSLLNLLWTGPGSGKPQALSDQRFAANLKLTNAGFDERDDTMTAIVGQLDSGRGNLTRIDRPKNSRQSMLPDAAAGIFAPGWDVSFDRKPEADPNDSGESLSPGVTFLTNYGLGSPFVEDSKLCAALSSFWPAVAPDITRTFAPGKNYATATPLTDEVIGLGSGRPWDGVKGPTFDEKANVVEYTHLAYGDYVQTALDDGFDIDAIGSTTAEEYIARTATMALVYEALDVAKHEDKLQWSVLSFKPANPDDPDLAKALETTGRRLRLPGAYRYRVFRHGRAQTRPHPDPAKFDKVLVDVQELVLLFADPSIALKRNSETGSWSVHELRH
jgi:hypothetical protein